MLNGIAKASVRTSIIFEIHPKTKRTLPVVVINSATKRGQSGKGVRKPFVVIDAPKHPQNPTRESDYDMEEGENVQSEASHLTDIPIPPILRSILYFRGLGRRKIRQVRYLLTKLGIPPRAVQFIQFVGTNVAELIVLNSSKKRIIRKLEKINVKFDPTFDLFSPRSFISASTIERFGLANKSDVEKAEIAKQAFIMRIDSMPRVIGEHRRGLRSFLKSLQRSVREGAPIQRFIDSYF